MSTDAYPVVTCEVHSGGPTVVLVGAKVTCDCKARLRIKHAIYPSPIPRRSHVPVACLREGVHCEKCGASGLILTERVEAMAEGGES